MKIDSINASRMGYGMIYLPFSIDIPDDKYWRYNDTDKNYAILVEAVLKFKEICEKQRESIEKKKQIINNLYGNSRIPCGIYEDAVDAFRKYNYVTTGRAQALDDFVTIWKDDYGSKMIPCSIDSKKVNENDTKNTEENNKETNETTAFTSREISW